MLGNIFADVVSKESFAKQCRTVLCKRLQGGAQLFSEGGNKLSRGEGSITGILQGNWQCVCF